MGGASRDATKVPHHLVPQSERVFLSLLPVLATGLASRDQCHRVSAGA